MSDSAPPQAARPRDRRVLWLRILLAASALSTANALRIVLGDWSRFVIAFPGADSTLGRACAIALPSILLVAIVGVWRFRRWGLALLAGTMVATIAFDLLARGPMLHLAAALLSSGLLAVAIWLNRQRFRDSGRGDVR